MHHVVSTESSDSQVRENVAHVSETAESTPQCVFVALRCVYFIVLAPQTSKIDSELLHNKTTGSCWNKSDRCKHCPAQSGRDPTGNSSAVWNNQGRSHGITSSHQETGAQVLKGAVKFHWCYNINLTAVLTHLPERSAHTHTHLYTGTHTMCCVFDLRVCVSTRHENTSCPLQLELVLLNKHADTLCFPEKLYLLPAPQIKRHNQTWLLKFNVRHLNHTKAADSATFSHLNAVRDT